MPRIYDRSWNKLRARFLRAFPLCRVCGKRASDVDHIVSVKKAPDRRLDWTNLQSLCHSCHSKITNAFDRPGWEPRGGCDAQGYSIDRRHPWVKMGQKVSQRVPEKQNWVRVALGERRAGLDSATGERRGRATYPVGRATWESDEG